MNWLDMVILVILIVSVILGLRTGIIKAALSLAGLIIGVVLAGRYYVALAGHLTFIPQASVAKIVAFAAILVGIMLIAAILANLLKTIVSLVMLGWVNSIGGAISGLLMGSIFCGALLALWVKYIGSGLIADSALAGILLDKFPLILAMLPDEFNVVRSFFQ